MGIERVDGKIQSGVKPPQSKKEGSGLNFLIQISNFRFPHSPPAPKHRIPTPVSRPSSPISVIPQLRDLGLSAFIDFQLFFQLRPVELCLKSYNTVLFPVPGKMFGRRTEPSALIEMKWLPIEAGEALSVRRGFRKSADGNFDQEVIAFGNGCP
jgi:hypothetical protein